MAGRFDVLVVGMQVIDLVQRVAAHEQLDIIGVHGLLGENTRIRTHNQQVNHLHAHDEHIKAAGQCYAFPSLPKRWIFFMVAAFMAARAFSMASP